VSLLFGRDGVWGPNIVADAEVALRGEIRDRKPDVAGAKPHTIVPLGHGQPTAVAGSMNGEALFIGFDNGDVVGFIPETGAVTQLEQRHPGAIESMATDEEGRLLGLIVGERHLEYDLSVQLSPSARMLLEPSEVGVSRLSNMLACGRFGDGIRWGPTSFRVLPLMDSPPLVNNPTTGAAMIGLVSPHGTRRLGLRFRYSKVEGFELAAMRSAPVAIDFGGHVPPPGSRLAPIEVRPLPHADDGMAEFSVLGIDDEGRVWISDLRWLNRLYHLHSLHTRSGGYLAAAMLGPTQAVGVLPDGLSWLRRDGHDLVPWTMTKLPLADAVAVWVGWQASEVIVVRSRGDLVRVPRPR
jgi:hypothetical protein